MRETIKEAGGLLAGGIGIAFWVLIGVGDLYWLWMSLKWGGFLMFFLGMFPPTAILFTAPMGAWSMVFGAPDWLYSLFD